jgi:hypothetical protein
LRRGHGIATAVLTLTVAALLLRPWHRFLEVDACLDAGGRWNQTTSRCEEARNGYAPMRERRSPITWTLILGPPLVAGALSTALLYAGIRRVKRPPV